MTFRNNQTNRNNQINCTIEAITEFEVKNSCKKMSRKANFLQRAEDFFICAISTETKSADSFNAKNSRQVTFRAV